VPNVHKKIIHKNIVSSLFLHRKTKMRLWH